MGENLQLSDWCSCLLVSLSLAVLMSLWLVAATFGFVNLFDLSCFTLHVDKKATGKTGKRPNYLSCYHRVIKCY